MLLEVRREQARLDVQKTLNDAMTAYSDSTKELEKYSEALEFSKQKPISDHWWRGEWVLNHCSTG